MEELLGIKEEYRNIVEDLKKHPEHKSLYNLEVLNDELYIRSSEYERKSKINNLGAMLLKTNRNDLDQIEILCYQTINMIKRIKQKSYPKVTKNINYL